MQRSSNLKQHALEDLRCVRFFANEVDCVSESSSYVFNRCRSRITPDPGVPSRLANSYEVSALIPKMKNVLFSKRGLIIAQHTERGFWVCNACLNSLNSGENGEHKIPPKVSIANGFVIGDLPPHLKDVTITERWLTSLASHRGHTVIAQEAGGTNLIRATTCDFVTGRQNRRRNRQNDIRWKQDFSYFYKSGDAGAKENGNEKIWGSTRKSEWLTWVFMKNYIRHKSLNESGVIAKMSQISDNELKRDDDFSRGIGIRCCKKSYVLREMCDAPLHPRNKQMKIRNSLFIKKAFCLLPIKEYRPSQR